MMSGEHNTLHCLFRDIIGVFDESENLNLVVC